MIPLRALICASLIAFATSASLAQQGGTSGPPGLTGSAPGLGTVGAPGLNGGGPPGLVTRGAPGPAVGVGLPALALVGGYIWFVRRRAKKRSL
jgi:hypothetical protein